MHGGKNVHKSSHCRIESIVVSQPNENSFDALICFCFYFAFSFAKFELIVLNVFKWKRLLLLFHI